MKQTKWTKKRSEGLPRWAMGLLMGLCIGLIVVALGGLVIYVLLTGGARKEFDELAQRVEKETVGLPAGQTPKAYADLKAENPDFVGWIKIEGTSVNYPVVQTKAEPQYYLRRSFEGSYSIAGTPFLDAQCDMEKGIGLIIYGHNMNDGSMFADLCKYESEDFYQEHKTIRFDTLDSFGEYEVIAAFKTVAYSEEGFKYYHFVRAEQEEDFDEFIAKCKELALYDTGVTAEYGDQLITLSTCEYSRTNGRMVVVAKLLEE